MEWLIVIGSAFLVYGVVMVFLPDNMPALKSEPKEVVYTPVQQPQPTFHKLTEASEHSTEYPNGVIISERRIKQWN